MEQSPHRLDDNPRPPERGTSACRTATGERPLPRAEDHPPEPGRLRRAGYRHLRLRAVGFHLGGVPVPVRRGVEHGIPVRVLQACHRKPSQGRPGVHHPQRRPLVDVGIWTVESVELTGTRPPVPPTGRGVESGTGRVRMGASPSRRRWPLVRTASGRRPDTQHHQRRVYDSVLRVVVNRWKRHPVWGASRSSRRGSADRNR